MGHNHRFSTELPSISKMPANSSQQFFTKMQNDKQLFDSFYNHLKQNPYDMHKFLPIRKSNRNEYYRKYIHEENKRIIQRKTKNNFEVCQTQDLETRIQNIMLDLDRQEEGQANQQVHGQLLLSSEPQQKKKNLIRPLPNYMKSCGVRFMKYDNSVQNVKIEKISSPQNEPVQEIKKKLPKKEVEQSKYLFKIDRNAAETQDAFKIVCGQNKDTNLKLCKLNQKMQLKAFLIPKYQREMSKKIIKYFDWRTAVEYDLFIEQIENLLNKTPDKLKKMAFDIFDYDSDGLIQDLDLFCVIKEFQNNEVLFQKAFSDDLIAIEKKLNQKKVSKGMQNQDVKLKLLQIDKDLQKLGGRLEVKTLREFNRINEETADVVDEDYELSEISSQPERQIHNTRLNRQTTTKSMKSATTSRSARSRNSRSSKGSNKSGQEAKAQQQLYDKIFGKKVNEIFQKQKSTLAPACLNIKDFIQIQWDFMFPMFVSELVEYLTGFSIIKQVKIWQEQEQKLNADKIIMDQYVQELAKNPDLIESAFRNTYAFKNRTDQQIALEKIQQQIGDTLYKKLLRFFLFISITKADGSDFEAHKAYTTEEQIKLRLSKYFGHDVLFLERRLYFWLADNQNLKKITFLNFLEKMLFLFQEGFTIERMRFVFFLLDWDQDGILTGFDLHQTLECIQPASEFWQEIQILVIHYEETTLKIKTKPNAINILQFSKYLSLLQENSFENSYTSCLLNELQQKILGPPGKFSKQSIFVPTLVQIESFQRIKKPTSQAIQEADKRKSVKFAQDFSPKQKQSQSLIQDPLSPTNNQVSSPRSDQIVLSFSN